MSTCHQLSQPRTLASILRDKPRINNQDKRANYKTCSNTRMFNHKNVKLNDFSMAYGWELQTWYYLINLFMPLYGLHVSTYAHMYTYAVWMAVERSVIGWKYRWYYRSNEYNCTGSGLTNFTDGAQLTYKSWATPHNNVEGKLVIREMLRLQYVLRPKFRKC